MHELGLIQQVLALAQDGARREGAKTIRAVGLRAGVLSGIVPEAIEFAFEASKAGTLAEEAKLEVEWVLPEVKCNSCGSQVELVLPFLGQCPVCGQPVATNMREQELTLVYVDVI